MALSVTVHGITVKTGAQTSGRLATADVLVNNGVEQVLYTVPENDLSHDYTIAAVSICNRSSESATNVNLAIADSDITKPVDFIEFGTVITPKGVLERTQIVVQRGQRLIVRWGDALQELVPDHEILDYANQWTDVLTGTATVDSTTPGQLTYQLDSGDTAQLTTNALTTALTEGATYRAGVSFYSSDVTGVNSDITLRAIDTTEATQEQLVSLNLIERDRPGEYRTYYTDFLVDSAGTYKPTISELRLDLADVIAVVDRITLTKIKHSFDAADADWDITGYTLSAGGIQFTYSSTGWQNFFAEAGGNRLEFTFSGGYATGPKQITIDNSTAGTADFTFQSEFSSEIQSANGDAALGDLTSISWRTV